MVSVAAAARVSPELTARMTDNSYSAVGGQGGGGSSVGGAHDGQANTGGGGSGCAAGGSGVFIVRYHLKPLGTTIIIR